MSSFFNRLALGFGRVWSAACNPLIVFSWLLCALITVYFQYRIYTRALPTLGKAVSGRQLNPEGRLRIRRMLDNCDEWRKVLNLMIPLFPQAGILGTVSALLLELSESGGIGTGTDNLRFAMTSTLYGLLAAILLKLHDMFLMRVMERVETDLDVTAMRKEV